MQQTYGHLQFKKRLVEEIENGDIKTTYLGYADYQSQVNKDEKGYSTAEDISEAIWIIEKTVETQSTDENGVITYRTQTSFAEANPGKKHKWTDRKTLNYVECEFDIQTP